MRMRRVCKGAHLVRGEARTIVLVLKFHLLLKICSSSERRRTTDPSTMSKVACTTQQCTSDPCIPVMASAASISMPAAAVYTGGAQHLRRATRGRHAGASRRAE